MFAPKRLEVEVRSEAIPDAEVEVIPIFTIDGQVVDAAAIPPLPAQGVSVNRPLPGFQLSMWMARTTKVPCLALGRVRAGQYARGPRFPFRVPEGLSRVLPR